MIYYAIYKSKLWKKDKMRNMKVFIMGAMIYAGLYYLLYSKLSENELVKKYRRYINYMMMIDIAGTWSNSRRESMIKKKKRKRRRMQYPPRIISFEKNPYMKKQLMGQMAQMAMPQMAQMVMPQMAQMAMPQMAMPQMAQMSIPRRMPMAIQVPLEMQAFEQRRMEPVTEMREKIMKKNMPVYEKEEECEIPIYESKKE